MFDIVTVSTILATILAIYAGIPYVISILRYKTKPHQFSWLIFVIMNAIVFFSQLFEGGTTSIIMHGIFLLGSTINFLLSLKYGTRDTSKFDRLLFCFALLTIVVWGVTRSNEAAIWLTLLIDLLAISMMILKLRTQPYSEDPVAWSIVTFANIFSLMSLYGTQLSILYVRPTYGSVFNGLLVAGIFYWRWRNSRQISPEAK